MTSLVARCRQFLQQPKLRSARKVVVALVGGTVVVVGVALIVLPGPAFLVIPLGLAILATEFLWARRWLQRARDLLPHAAKPPATPHSAGGESVSPARPSLES